MVLAQDITNCEITDVTDMHSRPRRIRKHINDVLLWLVEIIQRLELLLVVPDFLPFRLDFFWTVSLHELSVLL